MIAVQRFERTFRTHGVAKRHQARHRETGGQKGDYSGITEKHIHSALASCQKPKDRASGKVGAVILNWEKPINRTNATNIGKLASSTPETENAEKIEIKQIMCI